MAHSGSDTFSRLFGALALVTALTAGVVFGGAAASLGHGQEQAENVYAAIDRANKLAIAEQYQEALDTFRQADNLSNHTCADCYLGMVRMECQLGDVTGALADAQRAAKVAGDDHILAAQALVTRAGLLVVTSGGPGDDNLKEAEREYRQALSLDPKKSVARFALGMLLLQEGREAEGVAQLKTYIAGPFTSPRYVERATRVIADPSRARALPSDDFSFSTMDGEPISKAGLQGKVVLFDFWGTWCPVCRDSVPIMAELHQKFAGREFELVGIDSDSNEDVVKDFASSNHMDWPEFFDIDGQMQQLFEIQGYPTYVVLGRDGTIAFQQTGLGADTGTELTNAINRELAKNYFASSAPPASAALASGRASGLAAASPSSGAAKHSAAGVAAKAPVELVFPPEDVENGDADGNVYRNEFLGIFYKFPNAWTAATEEMLDQMNRARSQQMQSAGAGEFGEAVSASGAVRVPFPQIIFEASPDPRGRMPAISITVAQTGDSALESLRKESENLKQEGAQVLAGARAITIGKRQFVRADFAAGEADPPTWTTMIAATVAQRYLVTVEIRAGSKQEMDTLAATAQTLLISKP